MTLHIAPYPVRTPGLAAGRDHTKLSFLPVEKKLSKTGVQRKKFSAGLGTTRINGTRKFHTKLSFLPVNKKLSKTGVQRKNNIVMPVMGLEKKVVIKQGL